MRDRLFPLRFLLLLFAGLVNREQAKVIDYLREENRVLREQLGKKRLRLNDGQRARLAARAKALGRSVLEAVATIVTPETCSGGTTGLSPRSGRLGQGNTLADRRSWRGSR